MWAMQMQIYHWTSPTLKQIFEQKVEKSNPVVSRLEMWKLADYWLILCQESSESFV